MTFPVDGEIQVQSLNLHRTAQPLGKTGKPWALKMGRTISVTKLSIIRLFFCNTYIIYIHRITIYYMHIWHVFSFIIYNNHVLFK